MERLHDVIQTERGHKSTLQKKRIKAIPLFVDGNVN